MSGPLLTPCVFVPQLQEPVSEMSYNAARIALAHPNKPARS
jgi:hypothetical protein